MRRTIKTLNQDNNLRVLSIYEAGFVKGGTTPPKERGKSVKQRIILPIT